MDNCDLLSNRAQLVTEACTLGTMFIYMSVLLLLIIVKYKVFGFTLKLLVALEISVTALLIEAILYFRITYLCT
jgi:hypothetical protein